MITVMPIQEKAQQKQLCELCGIPYRAERLAYCATNEKGQLTGLCQFGLNAEGGHIYDLACPDASDPDDARFVMGRAALNFIDQCGVKIAFFDGEVPQDQAWDALLHRIGFVPDKKGRYTVSLDGFFNHPCQHHQS